jgi:DNA-binding NtrC family response regulator
MSKANILFVDDEPRAGELMLRFSEGADYDCQVFQSPQKALDSFKQAGADLVVTDINMPGMDGITLLREIRALDHEVPVIIITAYSSVDNAIEALRLGASDFLKKPYDMDELRLLIERTLAHKQVLQENRLLKRQLADEKRRYDMVGHSAAIRQVFKVIDKISDIRCHVMIEGESGTGKELVARAIHNAGSFADTPFVVIDCGALSETLLESELFGHEKGAFTGASSKKTGLLVQADGGTLFLDEIGNISDAMQTKLLRVIQEQQVMPVGSVKTIDIDVRFVVATNRDLKKMVTAGEFREDLYHRLNVVNIQIPPLRERKEDIPDLVQHLVAQFSAKYQRDVEGFDSASLKRMQQYSWPGNIRELSNVVERCVALADGPTLELDEIWQEQPSPQALTEDRPSLEALERRYILEVLEQQQGNREQTARILGINKSTLWRKLKQYGVS